MPRIASTLSILTVEAKSYEFLDYEVNLCCPLSDIQVHAVMQSPFVWIIAFQVINEHKDRVLAIVIISV